MTVIRNTDGLNFLIMGIKMDDELRNSGINNIGKIKWGTHIGQIYDSVEDFFSIAAPYMLSGLRNNEMCLWIYSQNTSFEEIINVLDNHIDDLDCYIKNGQLILIPYTEIYIENETFNEVRANSKWKYYVDKALEEGYDGLRSVADTYWLEKSYYRTFELYENNIQKTIPEMNFIVLCLYDSNRTDTLQIAEIIKNHSYVIIKSDDKYEIVRNVELLIKDKQLMQAHEYDKLKNEFMANVSHELRTPLNVILGTVQMLELIKTDADNIKEHKYIKILKQNCYRLVRLINNVIDITKIDAEFYDMKKQNCEIVNFVEEITGSVAEYALSKEIAVVYNSDTEKKVINCDPDQIERIILNLLSNSIKFTPAGGKVFVNVYDKGEKIEIIVKDTGIGIPLDKQKTIFKRFEQVDKSISRHEGSGIGLSLVKALVEKHDGTVTVNSEINKGSEFIIELPCNIENSVSEVLWIEQSLLNRPEKIKIEFSDI
jgi:signal transduction histidine kinase